MRPTATLIKAAAGVTSSRTGIENDERSIRSSETGELILQAGTASETNDGEWIADDEATLQFGSCCSNQFLNRGYRAHRWRRHGGPESQIHW